MNILYDRIRRPFFTGKNPLQPMDLRKDSFLLSSKASNNAIHLRFLHKRGIVPAIPLIGIVSSKEGRNKYKGNFRIIPVDTTGRGAGWGNLFRLLPAGCIWMIPLRGSCIIILYTNG